MSGDAVAHLEECVQAAKEDVNQANGDLLEGYKKYISSHESLYKDVKKMWGKLAKTDPLTAGEQLSKCLATNQKPIEELYIQAVHKRDYKAGRYNTLMKRLDNHHFAGIRNDNVESPPPDYDQLYPPGDADGLDDVWKELCLSHKVRNQLNFLLANRFSKEAVEVGLNIPNFVLYGSPGNGKTTLAKLICETLPVEWIYKDAGLEVLSEGGMENAIKAMFEEADARAVQSHQYCAIVLDNMESVQTYQQTGVMATLRAQLHKVNCRAEGKNVMFIGVTSCIEMFDSSFLTRDSIIEKVVFIDFPNTQERKNILLRALQKMHPKHIDQQSEMLPGLCDQLAESTLYYTRDNLVNGLLKTAESLALNHGQPLDSEHLLEAVQHYKRTRLPTEERRRYERNGGALARGCCDFTSKPTTAHNLLASGGQIS